MTDLLRLLAQNAPLLLAGTTVLLAVGCGAMLLVRSPVHRQRISELTIVGVLGWCLLALVPLPRLLPEQAWGAKLSATKTSEIVAGILKVETADESSVFMPAPLSEIPQSGLVLLPEVQDPQVRFPEAASTELPPDTDSQIAVESNLPATTSLLPSPSEEIARQATSSPLPVSSPTSPIWQLDLTKLLGLVTGAYLAGASLCLLWILAGYLLLWRIHRESNTPPDWLIRHFRLLARQSGIPQPRLIVSQLCTRPITWGVLWPVIVLPQSLCRPENKSQLTTILLHELGHIAQQDAQGNLLFCAALPLLYAHPLYWWLRRESQLAAELVADDWAAWQTGKETYVEELVALAKCTGKSSLPLVGVTGLFSSPSQFYRRMHMLLAREKPLSTRTSLPWRLASLSALAGAVALAASLAGVRPAIGQAPPATEPPAVAPATPPAVDPTTPPAVTPPVLPTADPPAFVPGAAPPAADPGPTTPRLPTATEPFPPPPVGVFAAPPATPAPAGVPMAVPPPAAGAENVPGPAAGTAPPTPANTPEEAALLKEIQQLRDKLEALEKVRRPAAAGGWDAPTSRWTPAGVQAINLKGKTVQLTRVDEQGVTWSEVWSTDDKGQPSKLITKSAKSGKLPPTAAAPSPDNKTIVREEDGTQRVIIVDAATGKTIEERVTNKRFPTPVLKPGAANATPPGKRRSVEYPVPAEYTPQPANVPTFTKGEQQLDLVSLATSYADAVSVLEAAEVKMAEIAKLKDSNVISSSDISSAKLALSAAKRKEHLLRSIAEVATASAAQEYERTAQLHKNGVSTVSAAAEAQARLDILKQILGTRGAENPSPPKP